MKAKCRMDRTQTTDPRCPKDFEWNLENNQQSLSPLKGKTNTQKWLTPIKNLERKLVWRKFTLKFFHRIGPSCWTFEATMDWTTTPPLPIIWRPVSSARSRHEPGHVLYKIVAIKGKKLVQMAIGAAIFSAGHVQHQNALSLLCQSWQSRMIRGQNAGGSSSEKSTKWPGPWISCNLCSTYWRC